MESNPVCVCGLLKLTNNDAMTSTNASLPRVPISKEADGRYYLHLTAEQRVEVVACPLCGGHERDAQGNRTAGTPCTCGSLAVWAASPDLPVRYDEQMNEYHLVRHDEQMLEFLFYYCVVCGGRLPESTRSSYFSDPTEEDLADVQQRTSHLKTIEEAIALLGLPDSDYILPEGGNVDFRRQTTFSNVWDSLELDFQEMKDGTLQRLCSGKPAR